jgi:hypothetical protein
MRVAAEDKRQVETSIDGTLYRARRGYFDMPDHHAAAHLRAGNLPAPALSGPTDRRIGYRCIDPACGRGSFFVKCGRCGAACVREV